VLMGTLFPLIGDAMDLKISISGPYFNAFFVPLTMLIMVFLVPGITSNWKKQRWASLKAPLAWAAIGGLIVGVLVSLWPEPTSIKGTIAFVLVFYVVIGHLHDWYRKASSFRQGLWRG